jgi:hypothetical protein
MHAKDGPAGAVSLVSHFGLVGLPGQSGITPVRGHELGTVDIAGQLTQLADYCDDRLAADRMSLSIAP